MKLSVKFQDDPHHHHHHHKQNPILKAKIPITIFNQPFISSTTTTTGSSPSDLSFSLSINFPSDLYLKLSYSPTTPPLPQHLLLSLAPSSLVLVSLAPHTTPPSSSLRISPPSQLTLPSQRSLSIPSHNLATFSSKYQLSRTPVLVRFLGLS
jgi:hypothetical protein